MGFFTFFIYVIVTLFFGLLLVGISLNIISIPAFMFFIQQNLLKDMTTQIVTTAVGSLIVLVCLRHIESLIYRKQNDRTITFESPDGKVSITLSAIEDMIKKILEAKSELVHIRPKVIHKKKLVKVIVKSNLLSETNILDLTRDIQEVIKEKLQNILGKEREISVDIAIRKILSRGKKGSKDEFEPEVPFRNY